MLHGIVATTLPQVVLITNDVQHSKLATNLERLGMSVIVATHDQNVLATFVHYQPDLVILDASSSPFNGFAACRRIHEHDAARTAPILLIVQDTIDMLERAFSSGATDVITTPIHGAVLERRVQHLLLVGQTSHIDYESQQRYEIVADTAPVLMWMTDADGRCIYFNQRWLDFTGRSIEKEMGHGWLEGVHPDDVDQCLASSHAAHAERREIDIEYRLCRTDGVYRWVLDRGAPHWTADGTFVGLIGSCVDVTERKQVELALQWANDELEQHVALRTRELTDVNLRLRAELAERAQIEEALRLRERAIAAATNSIIITGPTSEDNPILFVNESFERLTGYQADEVIGKNCRFLQGPDTDTGTVSDIRHAVQHGDAGVVVLQNYRKDGTTFWNALSISPVFDASGQVTHFVGIQDDVTVRKHLEEQLLHTAMHDPLTGLANRRLCMEHLQRLIARTKRHATAHFAVLCLDLDGFKLINDSLGHAAGDHLLIDVGRRLTALVRPTDTVARWGGDEFTLLLDELSDEGAAVLLAERLQLELSRPFSFDSQTMTISASVGVVVGTAAYCEAQDVLHDADRALYRAKAERKALAVPVTRGDSATKPV